ncbi:DUF1631 family protein [Curvibacter sp. HBC28]|uniref:DUF1631 family protein n=1 Tax=Curvibacter microcysteis TaxID=3026419 RepID=A0ABT5MDL9_9BURK|nr:DUF1631 family protein [Curvibacter sp. HBC28]MDD0814683.1 DUF1631 family protein [Curvibacter sp. HBC28]
MSSHASSPVPSALYQACVEDARREARMLIEKLVDYTRYQLREREASLRHPGERNSVSAAIDQLNRCQAQLIEQFVSQLIQGFDSPPVSLLEGGKRQSLMELRFDQLELMDEHQVQSRVELARTQQMTLHAVEGTLPELNALTCAMQGLPNVMPDRNPFRPEVYLRALQGAMESAGVTPLVRMAWTQQMCTVLGKELNSFYGFLNHKLRDQGVRPADYTVVPAGGQTNRPLYVPEVIPPAQALRAQEEAAASTWERKRPAPAAPLPSAPPLTGGLAPVPAQAPASLPALYLDEGLAAPALPEGTVLTVDRLRRLLGNEGGAGRRRDQAAAGAAPPALAASTRLEAFAQQFERQFEVRQEQEEAQHSDFQSTLPAAFDALDSPQEVAQVLQRVAQRQPGARGGNAPITVQALRQQLQQQGQDVGQVVALEVVTLMIENIVRDPRLLGALRQAVRELEPALAQLVVSDVRFFSDKAHPARRLLDALTQRSLAFESEAAPGFDAFMQPVRRVVKVLSAAPIQGAAPFDVALKELERAWNEHRENEQRQREQAVKALMHAEQRNLLAGRLRQELRVLPELAQAAPEVRDFLLGPWTQVMAQSRLGERASETDPGQYRALVGDLLWSANPALARQNPAHLTRLIPSLLGRVREGLKTIDYPPLMSSAFLEKLMVLHQAAYRRPVAAAPAPAPIPEQVVLAPRVPEPTEAPAAAPTPGQDPMFDEHDSDWLAPSEARVSGFMTLPEAEPKAQGPAALAPMAWEVGAWVELLSDGVWRRSQLSWASPHGTLFLFTRPDGSSQSMTRRMRDRLVSDGLLRVLADQPVVAGALDEVARTALRNTVAEERDSPLERGPGPVV